MCDMNIASSHVVAQNPYNTVLIYTDWVCKQM